MRVGRLNPCHPTSFNTYVHAVCTQSMRSIKILALPNLLCFSSRSSKHSVLKRYSIPHQTFHPRSQTVRLPPIIKMKFSIIVAIVLQAVIAVAAPVAIADAAPAELVKDAVS